MKKDKQKIIVIVGQTATGKSSFAVEVAKKINGEIISADSRQVYCGLDIGSGKIIKKEMCGIPHYLLDVANPKKIFTVSDFAALAISAMTKMQKRNITPIIAGGTGFYIDALLGETNIPEVPPDETLRKKLTTKTAPQLFAMLQKIDPRRAKNIDRNNPVRLIRAIEIVKALGKVPYARSCLAEKRFDTLKIGLALPDDILKENIEKRLQQRMEQGMFAEAKRLHEQGVSWKRMEALGLEYRYMALYHRGKISKEEMTTELAKAIWQYAKRQKTWFKRDQNIIWIDPRKKKDVAGVLREVKGFLKE